MDKITNFPDKKELQNTSYTENQGDLGIATLDSRLEIVRLNDKEFVVITPDGSQVHDREALAELLWVAAHFLDSECKWLPKLDVIACDY